MIKKLNIIIIAMVTTLFSLSASADNNVDIKAGFAADMGFGVSALINNKFSVMLGNDGVAADYIFKRGKFNAEVPFTWYIGAGAYNEWDKGFGVRVPLGLNLHFSQNWNAYAQVAPDLDFDDNAHFGAQLGAGLRYSF
ncbi:MAG: hypothetical protein ACJAT7_001916 [Psychromonas sp.]|jgi:hypothetical protein|uniref:hypothetical protein n=1 Tax=Psychromonas sp. TaxID=1884585 RepID=UPI0039E5C3D1